MRVHPLSMVVHPLQKGAADTVGGACGWLLLATLLPTLPAAPVGHQQPLVSTCHPPLLPTAPVVSAEALPLLLLCSTATVPPQLLGAHAIHASHLV